MKFDKKWLIVRYKVIEKRIIINLNNLKTLYSIINRIRG